MERSRFTNKATRNQYKIFVGKVTAKKGNAYTLKCENRNGNMMTQVLTLFNTDLATGDVIDLRTYATGTGGSITELKGMTPLEYVPSWAK